MRVFCFAALLATSAITPAWASGGQWVVTNPASGGVTPAQSQTISGAAQKSSNLSDLAAPATARSNIGAAASGANVDITALNGMLKGVLFPYRNTNWTAANGSGGTGSAGEGALYSNQYIYGLSNNGALISAIIDDGVVNPTTGEWGIFQGYDNIDYGATGNRQTALFTVAQGNPPAHEDTHDAVVAQAQWHAPTPSLAGQGWPDSLNNSEGGVETLWSTTNIGPSAAGLAGVYGGEIDLSFDIATTSTIEMIGMVAGNQTVNASNNAPTYARNGTNRPGTIANIGYDWFGPVDCVYCDGKPDGGWDQDIDTTIFGAYTQQYGVPDANPMARYFVDGRALGYYASSLAVPGFGVAPDGTTTAKALQTSGVLNAVSATLSGVTIRRPGLYTVMPTFSVQAPQSAGTTATVTAATVGLVKEVAYGSTGSGYHVNDVLSGTGYTFTVTAIDANGGITAGTLAGTGTNAAPNNTFPNPINTPTGGAGTGAMLWIGWNWDITGGSPGTGTSRGYVPTGTVFGTDYAFASTGKGYAAGDVYTVVGDTGTAGTMTVGAVSPTGGLMMGKQTLKSAGSVSALASSTYHTVTDSGAGTGAAVQTGYDLLSATTTPGAGYQPQPLPIITTTNPSGYGNADLVPTMATVAAPLSLAPNGGAVSIGSGGLTVGSNIGLAANAATLYQDPNNTGKICYLNMTTAGVMGCFMGNSKGGSTVDAWAIGFLTVGANGLVSTAGQTTLGATTLTAPSGTDNSNSAITSAWARTWIATYGYAPLASPALTGTPTAPTATAGTNTTQLATTAFSAAAITVETNRATAAEALKAPLNSPAFTGYVAFSGASALTAAGTTLATALALTKQENFVTTVASGTGVALPNAANYQPIRVVNRGANTLNIFPFSATDQIEATTAGTAATLASAATAVFERDAANHWDRLQ